MKKKDDKDEWRTIPDRRPTGERLVYMLFGVLAAIGFCGIIYAGWELVHRWYP